MIQVLDVYKTYDRKTYALADVTCQVVRGEMVLLTGPSGACKITLLRLLYGAEQPEHGHIIVNGYNITSLQRRQLPMLRRTLGMVFQDFKLLPDRTVFDNIAFALHAIGAPRHAIRQRVLGLLYYVGLDHKREALARQLAGGEQLLHGLGDGRVRGVDRRGARSPVGPVLRELNKIGKLRTS